MSRDESESRRCGGCGTDKPLTEFNWRRKAQGQRDNLCRPCRAAYHRLHYERNRQRYVDQARVRKQALARARTRYLIDFFASNPCSDCGEPDPVVLEFDNLGDKLVAIVQSLPYRAWDSILAEMAKCEVVCANCHRRRTATRAGFLRAVMTRSG